MKKRKGSLMSTLFIFLMLAAAVLSLVFVTYILMEIQGHPQVQGTIMGEILKMGINSVLGKVEYGLVFLSGTMLVAQFVRSYQIQVPMILLFPGIAFIGIASWILTKFLNIIWRIIGIPELAAAAAKRGLGVTLIQHGLELFLASSAIVLIVLHLSGRFNRGGGSA